MKQVVTVLMTNRYSGTPLSIVNSVVPKGFRTYYPTEPTHDALVSEARDADYILAGGRLKIDGDVLQNASHLKMIQRSGVGLDALDLEAIRKAGVPLYVNQGVNAESVAEHALLLMLACIRQLPSINDRTKAGIWQKQEQGVRTYELSGKTVGLVGMGHIARVLVGLLRPFGVRILYNDLVKMPSEFETKNNARFVELEELLRKSDVVSIHCALTSETKKLFNAETIGRMKEGAVLVNTARGGIVDPFALADALQEGRLSYAALDVHNEEPIPSDYPLKHVENVILTPHIGGVTSDSFRAMMSAAFRNIECFELGRLDEISSFRYL